jgi:hypothetical protein
MKCRYLERHPFFDRLTCVADVPDGVYYRTGTNPASPIYRRRGDDKITVWEYPRKYRVELLPTVSKNYFLHYERPFQHCFPLGRRPINHEEGKKDDYVFIDAEGNPELQYQHLPLRAIRLAPQAVRYQQQAVQPQVWAPENAGEEADDVWDVNDI